MKTRGVSFSVYTCGHIVSGPRNDNNWVMYWYYTFKCSGDGYRCLKAEPIKS